ncbi:hypothetical protein COCVIDRAFT_15332 [Bipolaris victoriae FI3]|uniref:DUF6594 domain-containing protein n=1 Tax=Bipolaris victoriae (strain FI3) TaxID=930091 RepID=W7EI71_BIPV3|nr:hypothetical protein COCVIDRAFT_15332 [Bipolaris victoriae FI3]
MPSPKRYHSLFNRIKALVSLKSNTCSQQTERQIEDYRSGHPQLSALIAADSCFHICRRFSTVRARLLLLKQDKISFLEQQLETTDYDEQAPNIPQLQSNWIKTAKRLALLAELDTRLADYG